VLETLQAGGDPSSLLRIFQIRALSLLGYALDERRCAACGEEIASGQAAFEGYSVVCRRCASPRAQPLSEGARRTLRAAHALGLERLGTLRISPDLDAELARTVEGALVAGLGAVPRSFSGLDVADDD
jgi:DNA repair protein RecO (recombination protein O)